MPSSVAAITSRPFVAAPRKSAWMRLPSGNRIDLLSPDPDAWTDADLARRLARVPRWAGESKWTRPLSVAQHSVLVMELSARMSGGWSADTPNGSLSLSEMLRELLHDAEEGLIGFDPSSPVKAAMGESFRAIANPILDAIASRYRLPDWMPAGKVAHKRADNLAAASEAVHVVGWAPAEIRDLLGITATPLQEDPLGQMSTSVGFRPWEPWPEDFAAEVFMFHLNELQAQRQAEDDTACQIVRMQRVGFGVTPSEGASAARP